MGIQNTYGNIGFRKKRVYQEAVPGWDIAVVTAVSNDNRSVPVWVGQQVISEAVVEFEIFFDSLLYVVKRKNVRYWFFTYVVDHFDPEALYMTEAGAGIANEA